MTPTTTVGAAVASAAASVSSKWRQWVDVDDVTQELWVWVLANQDKAESLAEKGWLARRLRTVGERYGRRQKAARSGYSPEDECFYTLGQLLRILPEAFDAGATAPVETYRESGNYTIWATELADVR